MTDTLALQIDNSPLALRKFLNHISVIENRSEKTVKSYYFEMHYFFLYIIKKKLSEEEIYECEDINILLSDNITDSFISTIIKDDILNYLYYLKENKKLSVSSRNHALSVISKFFNYCDKYLKILTVNPCSSVPYAKAGKKLPYYLTLDESTKLLDNLDPQNKNYERDYFIIIFILCTGVRLSELVGIDLSDIRDNTVFVTGKGSKDRKVIMNRAVCVALDEYLNWRSALRTPIYDKKALLISAQTGKRLKVRRVEDIVKKALKGINIEKDGISVHTLRHTAATLMFQNGVEVRTLQEVLGHQNLNTTQIYVHTASDKIEEAFNLNPLSKKGDV